MKMAARFLAALAVGAMAALPLSTAALAQGSFTIENPLVRPTIGDVPRSAGYFTLRNTGEADRLIDAEIEGAGRVELHTHLMEGGVMKMRRVPHVEVPGGGEVVFKPHGLHLMIYEIESPIEEGATLEGALVFEKAGRVPLQFTAGQPGMAKPAGAHDGQAEDGHGGHHGHH